MAITAPRHTPRVLPHRGLASPISVSALFQQALQHHRLGELTQAQDLYRQVIQRKPHHFDALHHLGTIALQLNQPEQALHWLQLAVQENPRHARAQANLAIVLYCLKQTTRALKSYDAAIKLNPHDAQTYCNRGIALRAVGQLDAAVQSYTQAIRLRPDYAEAYANRANALFAMHALEAAIEDASRAITLKPTTVQYYCNRSAMYYQQQQLTAALQDIHLALQQKVDEAAAYSNRAQIYLLQGQFEQGWQDYEWRLRLPEFSAMPCSAPYWRGTQSLQGKSILIFSEQGLGDSLQFCRYIPWLAELGASVYLRVQDSLRNLMQQLRGVHQVLSADQPLPALDFQCPLMSLPYAFRTNLSSIPSPQGYLHSPASHLQYWQHRLGEKHQPRIGVVCSGSPGHPHDSQRSIPLHQLLRSLPTEAQWVSLQNAPRAGDRAALQNSNMLGFAADIKDFCDTAALCACMDVVVTVDTSVAHLAAAMGKPTYVLLPYAPDWRWMLGRSDSPWYRSIKLYRQTVSQDWDAPLKALADDLAQLCGAGKAHTPGAR